jgi:hypothetical protein
VILQQIALFYSYKDYLYEQIAGQRYSIMFLWQMSLGRIRDLLIFDYDNDDESDDDDDNSEHGDIDNGDDDDKAKHKFSKDDKRGFIFSDVQLSDDDTYKCEAKNQYQQEVRYFYMHVGK